MRRVYHALSFRLADNARVECKVYSINEEFVCKLYINTVHQKDADYFTSDREDAKRTAEIMLEEVVWSISAGF